MADECAERQIFILAHGDEQNVCKLQILAWHCGRIDRGRFCGRHCHCAPN